MAYSKARRLSDSISATGEVSAFVDGSIVAADLNSTLDLTGKTVLVANASTGDSDTTVANTAFVQQEIAALVASAPGTLNTLNELAAALGDDASFSTTVTNSIALKAPLASPTFTGTVTTDGLDVSPSSGDASLTLTSNSSQPWKIYSPDASNALHFNSDSTDYLTIDTSGNVQIDGTEIVSNSDKGKINLWNSSSRTYALQMYHSGAFGSIGMTGAQILLLKTDDTQRIRITAPGTMYFYDEAGTTAGFTWDATNSRVGIGTSSPGAKLEIKDGDLWLNGASSGYNPEISFIDDAGPAGIAGAKIRYGNSDGNLYFEHKWDVATSGFFFRNRVDGTTLNTMALVNGTVTMPHQPVFRAQQSAAATLGAGYTTITFDDTVTGSFDIGGNFNNSTDRFTAPVAGSYQFNASIRCDSMNAYFRILISKNGSTDPYTNLHAIYGVPSGNYENLQVGGVLNLAATDYVTVIIYAVSDTDWNSQGEGFFSGFLIG